jgi:anti-sigma factor RsiW
MAVLLAAHVDGELSPRETLDVEQHLRTCHACRTRHEQQQRARTAVRSGANYHAAPAGLVDAIRGQLPAAATPPRPPARPIWHWRQGGAIAAMLVALTWSLGLYLALPSAEERLGDEVIANHVRSLLASHATDVASTDRHTVKPWFSGRLDYAPPVQDYTTEGFPLVGGRLDYLDARPVAALVYRHNQHLINLFVVPTPDNADSGPRRSARRGYHVIHWTHSGMQYWVVSDVDAAQLEKLQLLLAAGSSG